MERREEHDEIPVQPDKAGGRRGSALLLTGLFGGSLATRVYLDQAAVRGETTLRLAVSALKGHMSRFEPLPALHRRPPGHRQLIANPRTKALRDAANRYLKQINRLLGSSDIYVMIPTGETVAASNFDTPLSFVGENFRLPPLFPAGDGGRARPLLRARHDVAQARLLFFRAGGGRRQGRAASSSSRSTST